MARKTPEERAKAKADLERRLREQWAKDWERLVRLGKIEAGGSAGNPTAWP